MKYIFVISLALRAALAQTGTGSIAGTVLDTTTQEPVPAALVTASRAGAPPLTNNSRSGGDGAFQIQGLTPGNYLVCVQTSGDRYLNTCEWNGTPVGIVVVAGHAAAGIKLALTPASVLNVDIKDAQKAFKQLTKNGRSPDLSVGVWGPGGMYYAARLVNSPTGPEGLQANIPTYRYRLPVPRDTTLRLHVSSHDLKLGDADGVALPANANQQAFQHATGDAAPKSFTFTVLGKLP